MKPLAISARSPPLPERPAGSLGERIDKLRALLGRSAELKRKPDPMTEIEIELQRMEKLLAD